MLLQHRAEGSFHRSHLLRHLFDDVREFRDVRIEVVQFKSAILIALDQFPTANTGRSTWFGVMAWQVVRIALAYDPLACFAKGFLGRGCAWRVGGKLELGYRRVSLLVGHTG